MNLLIATLVVAFCFASSSHALPAKSAAGSACTKACPFNYDPICAGPQNGAGPRLSFGNECVLENYNCEHADKRYTRVSNGECPGSTGVRLQ